MLRTKAGKLVALKVIKFMKDKLPGVVVGGILPMAGTIWGILQIANDMAESVMGESKKAVEDLSDKLEELAEEQKNQPISQVLKTLGKVLHLGSDGIKFVEDHFLWFVGGITIILFLGIFALIYRRRKGRGPKVRVRVEDDSEDES